eukprot:TRINITY_DN36458_c0_g1_i1.p1 TRINITY_DN36458_c0_g1~~TRINITY_DN36458_c0_g1_i1.p1  ORF type:complete len:614 (+),score=182.70 TRINITY_DN36458_c0_g1_i1:62-1903(+)
MGQASSCTDESHRCSVPAEFDALVRAAEQITPVAAPGCRRRAVAVRFASQSGATVDSPAALVAGVPSCDGRGRFMHTLCFNVESPLARKAAALAARGDATATDLAEAWWVTGRYSPPGALSARYPRPFLLSGLTLSNSKLWLTPLRLPGPVADPLTVPRADDPHLQAVYRTRDACLEADADCGDAEPEQELGDGLLVWSAVLLPLVAGVPVAQFVRRDPLAALSMFFGVPLVDRTGVLLPGFSLSLTVLDRIPEQRPSLRDAPIAGPMEERAAELLDVGEQLCVMWSGGIDSTALLCAMLTVLRKRSDAVTLAVSLTQASIDEYPLFYTNVLQPEELAGRITLLPFDSGESVLEQLDLDRYVYVTGECGDQLFGSDTMRRAFDCADCLSVPAGADGAEPAGDPFDAFKQHGLEGPWEATVLAALLRLGYVTDADSFGAWIAPQLRAAPVPIVSTFDFLWWLNFSMKWQHVTLRCFHARPETQRADLKRIRHFYASAALQQWSMENHHHKMPDKRNWASYKMPLKEYIFGFVGDAEYRDTKVKVGSLGPASASPPGTAKVGNHVALALDDRFNVLRFGAASLTPAVMRRRYGGRLQRFFRGTAADPTGLIEGFD